MSAETQIVPAKPEHLPSPQLPQSVPLARVGGQEDIGSGKLSHNLLNNMLRTAGGEAEHVAGSLPPIKFVNEGDAFLLEFIGREEETTERDFALLNFYALDPKGYLVENRPLDDCRLYQGSISESWAFATYFAVDKVEARRGKVTKVTYVGQAKKAKEGRNAAHLYSIQELNLPGRVKVDGVEVKPLKGKGKK